MLGSGVLTNVVPVSEGGISRVPSSQKIGNMPDAAPIISTSSGSVMDRPALLSASKFSFG
jgi:hypothetical protein